MVTIDLPKAYRKFQNETAMVEVWVAVIDCGVQMNHPDLKGNLLTNYSVDVTQENKKLIQCEKGIFCLQPTTKSRNGAGTGHGTSYAAPQVAAMMKSINYDLTPAQILSLLQKNATVKVEVNTNSGVKRIPLLNAGRAVWMERVCVQQ